MTTPAKDRSAELFVRTRRHLRARRHHLTALARAAHQGTDPLLPVVAAAGWIPRSPLPVSDLRLSLAEDPGGTRGALAAAEAYWPVGASGRPKAPSYADAVTRYDPPTLWFDSPVYRLLRAEPSSGAGLTMEFSTARYFDAQDTAESLGYEAALRDLTHCPDVLGGRLRTHLADPFALERRCAATGVDTLTLIVDGSSTRFLMHHRSAIGTAGVQNAYHVVPAGEFQPRSAPRAGAGEDLDLVDCVVREYVEELLGAEDSNLHDQLDPAHSASYPAVGEAIRSGAARLSVLGLGLDPLTWKPEILTVCVWPVEVFNRVFPGLVAENEEGTLLFGAHGDRPGMPFSDEQVSRYLDQPGLFAGAGACLALARRWHRELGLPLA
ncbi:hypothetical protein ACWGKQ_08320 [Streptomyces sp. NPDC054770]